MRGIRNNGYVGGQVDYYDGVNKDTAVNGTVKAGRTQRSLKCRNCGQESHNVLTCKSHLPSKSATANSKRKSTNAGASSQQKEEKRVPMTTVTSKKIWGFLFT